MKRTVAFLAAVCVSTGFLFATSAMAQDTPPPPPTEASGDTVKTKAPETPATAQPAAAAPDTMTAAAKARRVNLGGPAKPRSYLFSLGLGSGIIYKPESLKDDFSSSFGLTMFVGAHQHDITVGVNFGYNFYLANGTVPNDLSILTIMADLRYSPTHSKARPYLVVCGGLFRQWIVDLDYTESVLGYGGGAGVDVAFGRTRALFFDVRYITGQTRETENAANTEIIPIRLGITWEFK